MALVVWATATIALLPLVLLTVVELIDGRRR